MEKVNLTKMFLLLVIISKYNMNNFFEAYNGGHCAMVLIKNVTTTMKGNPYLRAQCYIILTKVMDEASRTYLLQLHNNYRMFNLHSKR
jgi:hypothetical protein